MGQWAQGPYAVKNKDKFAGRKNPIYKSSWERTFMQYLDETPSIQRWSYEPFPIPYVHPLTHKRSNYWPDFLVQYIDKNGQSHVDLIEVKPASQVTLEGAGNSKKAQADVVVNTAKWEAAVHYAKMKGMTFKIVDETQIYVSKQKRKLKPRNTKSRVPRRRR
jgi:hypothetical protein